MSLRISRVATIGVVVIAVFALTLQTSDASRASLTSAAASTASTLSGTRLPTDLVRSDPPVKSPSAAAYHFSGNLIEVVQNTFSTVTVCHVTKHADKDVLVTIKDSWKIPRLDDAGAGTDRNSFFVDYRPTSKAPWRRFFAFGHTFNGKFDPILVLTTSLDSVLKGALPKTFDLRVTSTAALATTVVGFDNSISVAC